MKYIVSSFFLFYPLHLDYVLLQTWIPLFSKWLKRIGLIKNLKTKKKYMSIQGTLSQIRFVYVPKVT